MIARYMLIILIAAVVVVSLGCSASEPPTDPASTSNGLETQDQLMHPELAPKIHSELLGTLTKGYDEHRLSIKRAGKGLFRLQGGTHSSDWSGVGHQRDNELIVIGWFERHPDPAVVNLQFFATFLIDASDALHRTSYYSDGSVINTGILVRVD